MHNKTTLVPGGGILVHNFVAGKSWALLNKMFSSFPLYLFFSCPFLPNKQSILEKRGIEPTNPSTPALRAFCQSNFYT
jgi:hypothetical protein